MKKLTLILILVFLCIPITSHADNPPSEDGATFMALTAIGGAVSQGALRLFSGGTADTVSSGIIVFAAALTAYSNLPHVKRDFREKLANEIGIVNPEGMSDGILLTSVRDVGNNAFYARRWEQSLNIAKPTDGGGLRARVLALQR